MKALLLSAALLLAACGGSSEGGGGGSPTDPGPSIVFTPARAAGANSISMRAGVGSTASVLQLEIVATEVVNVLAVDFVLMYPSNLLRFDGFARGDFVGAGAQVITGGGSGNLSFAILRTAGAASGSGTILTLTLSATGGGSGSFNFVDPVAEDPFGLEIQGIDWIGGTVVVAV